MSALDPLRWASLWRQLGGTAPPGSFAELERHYGASDRHYHGAPHILACLAHFDRLRELADQPARVELALWLHDVIYDTRRQDNEAASAALACDWLAERGLTRHREALHALIMATCHQAGGLAAMPRWWRISTCRFWPAPHRCMRSTRPPCAANMPGFRTRCSTRAGRRCCASCWTRRRSTRRQRCGATGRPLRGPTSKGNCEPWPPHKQIAFKYLSAI